MGKEEDQSTAAWGHFVGRARWSWRVTEVGTAVKQNYHKDSTKSVRVGNVEVHIRLHK